MTVSHIPFNLGKFSEKVSRWKIVKIVSSEKFPFHHIVFNHLLLRCTERMLPWLREKIALRKPRWLSSRSEEL